jgi:hypothetical protein
LLTCSIRIAKFDRYFLNLQFSMAQRHTVQKSSAAEHVSSLHMPGDANKGRAGKLSRKLTLQHRSLRMHGCTNTPRKHADHLNLQPVV